MWRLLSPSPLSSSIGPPPEPEPEVELQPACIPEEAGSRSGGRGLGCGGLVANWWWKVKGWMGSVVGRWSFL